MSQSFHDFKDLGVVPQVWYSPKEDILVMVSSPWTIRSLKLLLVESSERPFVGYWIQGFEYIGSY